MRHHRMVPATVLTLVLTVIAGSPAHSGDDPEQLVKAAQYRAKRTLDPKRSGLIPSRRGPDGHLWVKPLVNGKDIGWFMFDTGKTGMAIDANVARELGLASAGETGLGGSAKGERFRMASFDLGPFRAVDLEAENMSPKSAPDDPGPGERAVGVVGSYVLRDVVSVIDLSRGVIALYAPEKYRPSGVRWLRTRMLPDVPAVEVKVEGRSTWLLIATGMPGAISLFDPESATRLGLAPLENAPDAVGVGGDGRRPDLRYMSASNVEFGGETRRKVRVTVPAAPMVSARASVHGLMGSRFLAGRTIVIDGPRRRVGVILT